MKKIIIIALIFISGCGSKYVNKNGIVVPTIVMPDLSSLEFIEIRTAEDFFNINRDLDKYYRLMNNIDFSDYTGSWSLIAPSSEKPFAGIIDGNGYKIIASRWLIGFINGGVIINLDLEDTTGGIVSYIENGMIINCHVSGNISGGIYQAGIAIHVLNSVIAGCSSSAIVISAAEGYAQSFLRSGGLFGEVKNSEIIDCYSTGDVVGVAGDEHHGYMEIGGIAGIVSNSILRNVYSTGNVMAAKAGYGNYIGGIVGVLENSEIANAYSTGNISGRRGVGGIAGIASRGKITNVYSKGQMYAYTNCVGAITGNTYKTDIINISFEGSISMANNLAAYAGDEMFGCKVGSYKPWMPSW